MRVKDSINLLPDYGPHLWGAELAVNANEQEFKRNFSTSTACVIDVEDNEDGQYVGLGLCWDASRVFYFSTLPEWLITILSSLSMVAHNGKSDLHKLKKWGVNIRAEQLHADTMIMSYVVNSTRESHGLKDLAKDLLNLEWPSYKSIVGTGKAKRTLDQHSLDTVSRYNGCDCIATYKLHAYFNKVMTANQREYYEKLELPVTRILYEMEDRGVLVDVEYLRKLDTYFEMEANRLALDLVKRATPGDEGPINLNSPKQVQALLFQANGINVKATNKEALKEYANVPLVQRFHRYRELTKLRSTYTQGLLSHDTLPRVHAEYNQCSYSSTEDKWGGIRTGRLSSSNPNLQNIPTRTETGDCLRRAFVARPGFTLVDADYSQIEWRLAAHFSQDEHMINVLADASRDIYQELATAMKCDRGMAKTMALAMNYNAGAYKVASILRISTKDAFDYVDRYKQAFPQFFKWKDEQIQDCQRNGYIQTLYGRCIAPEKSFLAVPYQIQGSAAEIIKKAMLLCNQKGYQPLLTVHDELLFELRDTTVQSEMKNIQDIMESIIRLRVPLKIDMGHGTTWQAAKN